MIQWGLFLPVRVLFGIRYWSSMDPMPIFWKSVGPWFGSSKGLLGGQRGSINPILTGPLTSNILTGGASQALHFFSKMATTKCQDLIYYWYINHFSPFKPLSSLLLRFFKKCVIEIQKTDHFWKFFSKKSKIEFDTSKWRARWVDYDYGRFFSLRQLFGALLVDFLVHFWGGPNRPYTI